MAMIPRKPGGIGPSIPPQDPSMGMPPMGGPSPTFPTGAPVEQQQPNFFSRLMQALARINQQPNPTGIPGQTPPYFPEQKKKGGVLGGLSKLKNTGGGLDQFKPPIDIDAPNIGPSQMYTRYPNAG